MGKQSFYKLIVDNWLKCIKQLTVDEYIQVLCFIVYSFYMSKNNSQDNFLNGFTRLSGLTVPGSRYFLKVSSTPDFDNKILSTVESGF